MTRRYHAHAVTGHGHWVEARSFEDAALCFAEAHAGLAEEEQVQVIVQEEDGGPERCFIVHLDGGVEGCA